MRADIGPGTAFPDYELPDHAGRPRRLAEIQGNDPMIIVLAREAYSAKDQVQHEGLVQLWREMKPGVGYRRMVTITTTDAQEALNYRNGVGTEWPFLADPGRMVQRDLDIAEYTDPAHDQMVPHTIVCEPKLIVYKIYQRLLVLRAPHRRGAAPGPARGAHEAPLGLGSVRPRGQGRVGARRDRAFLPARTGLAPGRLRSRFEDDVRT
jgi:peroxiredoxin